jgi:hypothetical protein
MTTQNFKVRKSKKYEFYTEYTIWFKGTNKEYICNHNGGLPKLDGKRLSERLRCELSDLLEEHFLNNLSYV